MDMRDAGDGESAAQALGGSIAAMLGALGGRYALEARRLAPATRTARPLPMAGAGSSDDDDDDHDAQARVAPAQGDALAVAAEAEFPAASLAKLPIAVELMRRVSLGQLNLDERLDASAQPRAGGGGVLDSLDLATRLSVSELCTLALAASDNTAANLLLDLVGMGEVNHTMERLGLPHTRLARRFMDLEARLARRDNVTSAGDMVALLALLYGNALPGARRLRAMLAAQLRADDLRAWLPETARLEHKTGELEDIFHDAGLLTGPSSTVAFCVLTAGQGDLPAARFAVGRMLRALWDAWCA
ncbi:MAG: serine hydrolase [Ktedonobacterales bacterium]